MDCSGRIRRTDLYDPYDLGSTDRNPDGRNLMATAGRQTRVLATERSSQYG